jgi:hypothetical protein
MQLRSIYGVSILLFLLSGLLIVNTFCGENTATPPLVKADIFINSGELAASFDSNEALSDSLYLYKVLSVRGIIKKILKKESGNYVITLGDPAPGTPVVDCHLDTIYNSRFLPLKNGDSVVLRGTCAGRLVNVILMQCIIEKQ